MSQVPNESDGCIATGPPDAEAGGVLTIDLGALVANWRLLQARAGGAECAAVAKADGYGLGLSAVVRALRVAGCRSFFVADLSEAVAAREACGDGTVHVLNGLLPGTASTFAGLGLTPILGSQDEIAEWAGFCRNAGARYPAALHFDTGMNRLGLPAAAAAEVARSPLLADFEPALVMSHFVSAEEPENPLNARQIGRFAAVRQAFPEVRASLCNSSGGFLPERPHYDLVRPGYALYGGNPTPGRSNPMQAVIWLQGRIVQIRAAPDGDTVGYADGYPRAASATDAKRDTQVAAGAAIVAGLHCPFAGRVSMDLIVVDITEVPAGAVKRGDLVTLIGADLTIDEVGRRAGTIGYEILTSLGRRYARRYIGGA